MSKKRTFSVLVALVMLVMTAGQARAALIDPLGVLDLSANGGLNPTTGLAWQAGDTFRLAFVSAGTRNATSTNINDYNTFVQNAANASSLGLGAATWKVIASTETVNARVNTGTTGSGGEAIFLVDGLTQVANNYGDLWNGNVDNPISLDENGNVRAASVWAGTTPGGATVTNRWLGTVIPSKTNNTVVVVEHGRSDHFHSDGHWIQQFNNGPTASQSLYGLSNPITLREAVTVPEPATATLALLGLGGLMMRRRRDLKA